MLIVYVCIDYVIVYSLQCLYKLVNGMYLCVSYYIGIMCVSIVVLYLVIIVVLYIYVDVCIGIVYSAYRVLLVL